MTATRSAPSANCNAGPDFTSVTSPHPMMPKPMVMEGRRSKCGYQSRKPCPQLPTRYPFRSNIEANFRYRVLISSRVSDLSRSAPKASMVKLATIVPYAIAVFRA